METPLTPVVFHILLAMVDGEKHGYAIMKHVEEHSGQVMGPGTVYGSIQRMEEAGLVRESSRSGKGRRRLYEMTAAGRSALRAEARRIDRVAGLARARGLVAGRDRA
jgi:DNA-binding PadR family transcriptional regulator